MNGLTSSQKYNNLIQIGGGIILLIIFVAIFAPILTPYDPNQMSLQDQFEPPSPQHLFGLDQNGSDVFSKVIYGARISLLVAITVVSICLILGLLMGSLAGYMGGVWDHIVMRLIDMLCAFPGFLVAISLVAVLGPSVFNLILAMSLTGWASYARLIRGEFLHLKTKDYVVASVAMGASPFRQIVFHIWPNLIGALVVQVSFSMAGTIISESSLSFLGLGVPPTTPTWGSLLNAGKDVLIEAPHISIFPGMAIVVLVLGFNLFGDGLRDMLDPLSSK